MRQQMFDQGQTRIVQTYRRILRGMIFSPDGVEPVNQPNFLNYYKQINLKGRHMWAIARWPWRNGMRILHIWIQCGRLRRWRIFWIRVKMGSY